MRVENHTGHVMRIPIMAASGAEKRHVSEVDNVTLLPGVNEVDPSKWAKCEPIDLIRRLVKAGERKGGIVVGDPKKSLRVLSDLDEDDAIETVEGTFDAALLGTWAKNDRRTAVLEAVVKQIDLIDPKEARTNAVRG